MDLLLIFFKFLFAETHGTDTTLIFHRLNFPSYYTKELYICYFHLKTPLCLPTSTPILSLGQYAHREFRRPSQNHVEQQWPRTVCPPPVCLLQFPELSAVPWGWQSPAPCLLCVQYTALCNYVNKFSRLSSHFVLLAVFTFVS